jgi:Holliday junction resolvase
VSAKRKSKTGIVPTSKVTNYERGRSFEYKVQNDLRSHGFTTIRSAGSHSPADLIAVKSGQLLFVQCKRDGKISVEEQGELVLLSQAVGVAAWSILAEPGHPGVAYWFLRPNLPPFAWSVGQVK